MSPENQTMLRAVRDTIDERIKAIPRHAPQVYNEVPVPRVSVVNDVKPTPVEVKNLIAAPEVNVTTPEVVVDLTPVAEALDRMTDALTALWQQNAELIRVLTSRPAPVVNVAPAVGAPAVTVQVPPRPARRLVVKHGDGSETVITEE